MLPKPRKLLNELFAKFEEIIKWKRLEESNKIKTVKNFTAKHSEKGFTAKVKVFYIKSISKVISIVLSILQSFQSKQRSDPAPEVSISLTRASPSCFPLGVSHYWRAREIYEHQRPAGEDLRAVLWRLQAQSSLWLSIPRANPANRLGFCLLLLASSAQVLHLRVFSVTLSLSLFESSFSFTSLEWKSCTENLVSIHHGPFTSGLRCKCLGHKLNFFNFVFHHPFISRYLGSLVFS